MMNQINNFLRNEEGASAVEYGLIVGLIAVVIVSVLITSGQSLNTLFGNISTALSDAAAAAGGGG